MEITAEVEVREGELVKTPTPPPPPPTKTGRKYGAVVITFGKEVGWRREKKLLGGWRKRFLRPCHQGAHSEDMPSALTVYS